MSKTNNSDSSFSIAGRRIGGGAPALLIAEVAQAHDGSLGMAHAFIDMIADAGADAVKFQTHIAAAESTLAEPWRTKFSLQDATRFDYWRRMEFTAEQWQGLANHAKDRDLMFLSSPFSEEAIVILEKAGVPAWKVASGEVGNTVLIDRMCDTGLPILLSSGISSYHELDATVARIKTSASAIAIMQCTTAYPCPPEAVGLNVLDELRERYDVPVGLSDHSGVIYPCLAAVVKGAAVLETHVTFHRKMFGPDVPASLTPEELAELVRGIRYIERMMASPVEKDSAAAMGEPLRKIFTKSIVANAALPAGTRLERSHVAFKKPGTGIPVERLAEVLGRKLRVAVDADEILQEAHLEPHS